MVFERRFTADNMAARYVDVYHALIDSLTSTSGGTGAPADGAAASNVEMPF